MLYYYNISYTGRQLQRAMINETKLYFHLNLKASDN